MLIAQLTDFHVTAPGLLVGGRVDTRATFTQLMADVHALPDRPDMLLVTGDMGEAGSEAEYAFVADGLDALGIPFAVIPGNHDLRAPLRQTLGHATGREPGHLGLVRTLPGLRFIGLDTLVEGASHGALQEDQIEWLRATLAADPAMPTVMFMHHPPFATGMPAMDAIGLRDGREALDEIVSAYGQIVAILCGHIHRAVSGRFAGVRTFVAPSASHQFALDFTRGAPLRLVTDPPQIALHRWADDTLASHLLSLRR